MFQLVQKDRLRPDFEIVMEEFDTQEEAESERDDLSADPLIDAVTYYIIREV